MKFSKRLLLSVGALWFTLGFCWGDAVQSRRLQDGGFGVIDDPPRTDGKVETTFSFEYKILANITPSQLSVGAAMETVQDAILVSLNQAIATYEADIGLDFLASKQIGPCEDALEVDLLRDFDECSRAESQIRAFIPPDMNPALVERIALMDIQKFIVEFNANNKDIQIHFEYPITVSAVVEATMEGVVGPMSTNEKQVLETKFMDIFAPLLQTADTVFTLDTLEVLGERTQQRRRLKRVLQEELPEAPTAPYNTVDLYLRATCRDIGCTDDAFQAFLLSGLPVIAGALEIALRNAGRNGGTDYFEALMKLSFNEPESMELPPSSLSEPQQQSVDKAKTPFWVWIVLGVDALLLALTMVWVTIKKTRSSRDDDDKESARKDSDIPEQRPEDDDERRSLSHSSAY